jgi:hypothetical protein
MARRPIRELICPDIEEPIGGHERAHERRYGPRFARCLPGVLIIGGIEHPVTCVDIGPGGMGVFAPTAVRPPVGRHAVARIELNGRLFENTFSVAYGGRTADATAVRVGLAALA